MGAAARRARRRASGTLTLTMPGSAGGRSPGVAGSLPVSRQAAGWAELPAACPGSAWRRGRGGAGGGDGQQRLGAHGQHGVAVEGAPQPDLVLVQARLAFSLLVAFFCGPSLPGHRDQDRQRHRPALRHMAVEERQVSGVGQAAADQHPVPRRGGGGPRPGVVAAALAAGAARAGLPRRGRHHRGDGGHGRLAAGGEPDGEVHRDREHVPLAGLLAGLPQPAAAAVHLVAGHPGERHARPDRGGDHRGGQRRLGSEPRPGRARAPGPAAPGPGTTPSAGRAGSRTARGRGRHVRGEHHGLAVLHLPGDPGVLPGDPHRGGSLLQLGSLVDRQDRSRIAQPARR